jgi:hypothetical protein
MCVGGIRKKYEQKGSNGEWKNIEIEHSEHKTDFRRFLVKIFVNCHFVSNNEI